MKLYEEYEYKKDSEFNKLTPKINSQKIVIITTPNNSNFIQRKVYDKYRYCIAYCKKDDGSYPTAKCKVSEHFRTVVINRCGTGIAYYKAHYKTIQNRAGNHQYEGKKSLIAVKSRIT